ncbi:glycine/betaine ABC transporter permease [Pseudoclavibacter sp. RFBJ3]|uniref:BCCT family transporter n=1 Tax=unclassified Pseudoclavibacter TaxID=2615177 RepID=UPI000CE7E1BB|nr:MULTISPECIES: BCCT family transporter [unclassified Pseudoclavibacter]PPF83067.1 glycine/betaine ABC transporter permease [Pseudoclavibacter sp. RFBJ5]PPF91766.1 glycine/betaine ABC transporter permease [Pseudoclavibacter sp. RFBJ3]PPF96703.1 glycine/betaine ABC transporter permease [Pseudoclavibacter sp. RFBH5]PPG19626.1 glycine/betaine ABC transporter permease [Pseudoclavibacter sp. RFBI4]
MTLHHPPKPELHDDDALDGHGLEPTSGPSRAQAAADALRHRPGLVFWVSIGLILAFVSWAAISPDTLNGSMTAAITWASATVGWSYLLVTIGCIGLLVYLACSRFGRIRLGADSDRPEFSTWAWLAMILSAVMGVGLISYGVAEPISHFVTPPHGLAESGTVEAAVVAMQFSYFDWGPHAWAVFGVFGVAIAYSTHRKGNTGLVSPMLRPIFGDRVDGWLGNVIDIFAIIATLFGTTTSLGLGASQITEGLNRVMGLPTETFIQILVIAVITVIFTLSALSGVNRGIKYISQITMLASVALGIFVFFVGPTNFITNLFVRSTGAYVSNFFEMSLTTPLTADDGQWMQWWTYFMMAWWLSWGAFVGVFLAKISRGRTIRQFVLGVMVVPSLVFFGWFTIFGGSAIKFDLDGDGSIGTAATADVNSAFFEMLSNLPLVEITSIVAIVLVVLFFISGADANTFVLSMLSSRGALEPAKPVLAIWGLLTGLCASLLLLTGGLAALQQAAMLSALPFTIIVALLGISLILQLREDPHFDYTRDVRREDLRTGVLRLPEHGPRRKPNPESPRP